MEVYAGFLEFDAHHVGRLIDALHDLGCSTIRWSITSSATTAPRLRARRTAPTTRWSTSTGAGPVETPEFLMAHLDSLGGRLGHAEAAAADRYRRTCEWQVDGRPATGTRAQLGVSRQGSFQGGALRPAGVLGSGLVPAPWRGLYSTLPPPSSQPVSRSPSSPTSGPSSARRSSGRSPTGTCPVRSSPWTPTARWTSLHLSCMFGNCSGAEENQILPNPASLSRAISHPASLTRNIARSLRRRSTSIHRCFDVQAGLPMPGISPPGAPGHRPSPGRAHAVDGEECQVERSVSNQATSWTA